MRNAPSVVYPVGRCRFYAALLVTLGVVTGVMLVVVCWPLLPHTAVGSTAPPPPSDKVAGLLGALLWLGWSGFAGFSWLRSPTGVLQWDAQAPDPGSRSPAKTGLWRWTSAAYREGTPLKQVSLVLDLQSRLLIRLRNTDGVHTWVWLAMSRDPGRWNDLRRALVATQA